MACCAVSCCAVVPALPVAWSCMSLCLLGPAVLCWQGPVGCITWGICLPCALPYRAGRGPLAALLGGGPGQLPHSGVSKVPANAVGVPVTSVVCSEGGLMTAGLDGAVRYHPLASLISCT